MRSHVVTAFLRPGTVRRQISGPWLRAEMRADDILFIPRGAGSVWEWNNQLQNIHLHISDDYFSRVADDVFGRTGDNCELVDRLSIPDTVIASTLKLLAREALSGEAGEQLYVDAIATQLCVHLLRHYTSFNSLRPAKASSLDGRAAAKVRDYIEEHLSGRLDIRTLAEVAKQSPFHFIRVFKHHFETTPHEYVVCRRLEKARLMIEQNNEPLKRIAVECGFYDQAHMSRQFKARFGLSPGQYKKSST